MVAISLAAILIVLASRQPKLAPKDAFTFTVQPGLMPIPLPHKLKSARDFVRVNIGGRRLLRAAHQFDVPEGGAMLHDYEAIAHPLVQAAALAFKHHLALSLRPQHLWLVIAQEVAVHVDSNAEALRSRFMLPRSGEKVRLELDITEAAVRGLGTGDWAEFVESFVRDMELHTQEGVVAALRLSTSEMSDTTSAEIVASSITSMAALKSYFSYEMLTMCGFPSITLEGTAADWRALREKAERVVTRFTLPAFSKQWLSALLPVLDRFVAVREGGGIDERFWSSMAKLGGTLGSGAVTWVSGWINVFLPHLGKDATPNPYCVPYDPKRNNYTTYFGEEEVQRGPRTAEYRNGMTWAPVTLDHLPLEFRAGLIGVAIDPATSTLSPVSGWFITSADPAKAPPSTYTHLERIAPFDDKVDWDKEL